MIGLHSISATAMASMLRSLDGILDKGAEHARAKKFDETVLASARLAPDMFPLAKHVIIACDLAEEALSRLAGRPIEKGAPGEETYAGVRTRIAKTLERIDAVKPDALEGAEDRAIEIPISKEMGFSMTGLEYLRDWALPQLHFHAAIAYAILRNNGVELGMKDWGAAAGAYLRKH